MKLFTKFKKEFSSKKVDISKKDKNHSNRETKKEWLLSDDQFNSILQSSTPVIKKDTSKIEEILSDSEDEDD